MNTLFVMLQFGAKMDEPLSSAKMIIFWGLILLFVAGFIFFLFRTDKLISKQDGVNSIQPQTTTGSVSDEEAAAIALAIHMYKIEMHDMESLTITLKKVSRIYSPWSSKIYTLRQNPRY